MPNFNEVTGIRFGIISANSLHPEVIDQMQQGKDLHYEEVRADLWARVEGVCQGYMSDEDASDVADLAVENLAQNWQDEEPIHAFDIDGVKGQTTWLGGALLVWVFESPVIDKFNLGSPCVPNAVIISSPNPDGFEGYGVPADWVKGELDGETS